MDDELLDTRDVARILGISRKTVESWRYLTEPYGPTAYRVGRRSVRYYRSDVEAWLEHLVEARPLQSERGGRRRSA